LCTQRPHFEIFLSATFAQGILTANLETSPLPTPPARAPNDHEWRFKNMTLPCEWIEDYRPGDYHPVHLGDIFKYGQYKVLRKLPVTPLICFAKALKG
jgi:hypothetical protein